MKILVFEWGAYTWPDTEESFIHMGLDHDVVSYQFADKNHDDFFVWKFLKILDRNIYTAVYSINYFPLVAECCHRKGILYVSWSYDNPLNVVNIEETLGYETNRVYLFDRVQVQKYLDMGFEHIYHMPLAVNIRRLDGLRISEREKEHFGSDVAFVGKLYESDLGAYMSGMDDYHRGYIQGLIQIQQNLYGCYVLDELITDKFIEEINTHYLELNPETEFRMDHDALSYAMAAQVTRNERLLLLSLLSAHFPVKLYSRERNPMLDKVKYMAAVGYLNEMPKVFRSSRINLNINLKISQSGVPLRVMDILGAGGFLLSSYQPEVAEFFVPGEEAVLYESIEDAYEKVGYYLSHEEERKKIAENGHRKVSENFTYDIQLGKIFGEHAI